MIEAGQLRAVGQANDNRVKALQQQQDTNRLIQEAGSRAWPGGERTFLDQLFQNQLLQSIDWSGSF